MRFARLIFALAGTGGLLLLVPMFFLEARIGREAPPPITHPEFFYGFVGLGCVFQVVFLVIASNPLRYRLLMPIGILEKLAFSLPVFLLYLGGRIGSTFVPAAVMDFTLGCLFALSWWLTRCPPESPIPVVPSGSTPPDRF